MLLKKTSEFLDSNVLSAAYGHLRGKTTMTTPMTKKKKKKRKEEEVSTSCQPHRITVGQKKWKKKRKNLNRGGEKRLMAYVQTQS